MTDEELNEALDTLADTNGEIHIPELSGTGKLIPYYGWYWRDMDFSHFDVAQASQSSFIGFCVNNKWDYVEWSIKGERANKVRALCVAIVESPIQENYQALFDYMQTLTPQ